MGGFGALFLALLGCRVDLSGAGPAAPVAPVAEAQAAPLYQQLYEGEQGEPARSVGQRARMLIWLGSVAFTEPELAALRSLAVTARADAAAAAARGEAARAAEAALVPTLQAIADRFAAPPAPSEAELAELGARLSAARAPFADPRAETWRALTAQLTAAESWARTLPAERQERLADARFFLQHRMGALVAPGAYTDWLGTPWNGSDFGALRVSAPPSNEPQLNIGGLWAADVLGHGPDQRIRGTRLAALLVLAFAEPGLLEAIDVKLGARGVADYGEPVTPR